LLANKNGAAQENLKKKRRGAATTEETRSSNIIKRPTLAVAHHKQGDHQLANSMITKVLVGC
jgi:hypothetical protein